MFRLVLASVCFLCLAGCTGGVALGPDAVKGKVPDGAIEMHEVQAAYIGTASGGDLWLQNEAGVILHLKAKRTGLMLSLGGDAVVISMRQ
jgi:hypothetical protein